MALDAVSLMRPGVRGTPSWPGHDPETGYVGADRSDHSQKLLADRAGHTFLKRRPLPQPGHLKRAQEYPFRPRGPAQRRRGPPGLTVTLIRSEMTGGS